MIFEYALAQEAQFELVKFDEKFSVFRELRNNIYGAIGEQKVIEELKNLGHDCIVINDFKVYFNTPLINKKEDYYINSIQVDHLAITRAGVFIIETKNWSANSQQKIDLRSPIEQVRRTGYAVYHLLNNNILMKLRDSHHWGQKNINTRNVVVLIQSHSTKSFQFVKLVNLNQLNGYIQYFQPEMTINEVEKIAEYFLNLNNEWLG